MNIITKICIVLIALLSVCVSVVFSRQALVQENYRQGMIDEGARADLADTGRDNAEVVQISSGQEIRRLKAELNATQRDLALERQGRADDVRRLRTDLAGRNEDVKTLTVKVGNFADALREVEQGRSILTEQNKLHLEHNKRLQDELTGTGNHLAVAVAKIERLNATVRLLKERVVQLEEQYAILATKYAILAATIPADGESGDLPATDFRVNGTVTAVRNNMASINLGSVKNIKKNMTLYIYRGDRFIAHLRIIDVDDGESTGEIYDPREGASPKAGDKVTTSLR